MSGDAFTKPEQNPADFDIDAWISGAALPERAVTIYARGDLAAQLQELEAAHDRARTAQALAPEDGSLGGDEEPVAIARQMTEIRKQLQASALTIRLRAAMKDETAPLQKQHKDDEDAYAYAALELQCVSPKITAAQWKALRGKIGEGQFNAVLQAAGEASYGASVDVPFSPRVLSTLAGQDSSTS